MLDRGVDQGLYDIGDPLERYVTVALFFCHGTLTTPQPYLSLCLYSLYSAGG